MKKIQNGQYFNLETLKAINPKAAREFINMAEESDCPLPTGDDFSMNGETIYFHDRNGYTNVTLVWSQEFGDWE